MATSLMRPKEPKIEIDKTLTQEGVAADAKAVGDALTTVRHKFECGEGKIPVGETALWKTVRVTYKYPHDVTPVPVVTHYRQNVAQTAFTIVEFSKTGFTVGVYHTPDDYRAFTWIAVEPD